MKKISFLLLAFMIFFFNSQAQDSTKTKSFEVFGFAMTDAGYNFNQINPAWFDAMRVTKLPTYANQYGSDGNAFFSVRQTRFGVRAWFPTPLGELKTVFDFDMFGVGVDEGQTTMRLRNAYGELGPVLIGQANTPFMDGDVFPNIFEYWGPTGMVFFRNIQIRYAILKGKDEVFVALERPGASADKGSPDNSRVDLALDSVAPRYPLPDLSAHYKKSGDWGHVQLAGMLRYIGWTDIHTGGGYDLTGNTIGWGLHLSTVINITPDNIFRGSFVYGQGVENYMNDCPVDVGIEKNGNNTTTPLTGKALPVTGWIAYFEHNWSKKWSSTIGFSATHVENTSFGSTTAYADGQYGTLNIISTPVPHVTAAAELQYGRRANFGNDFTSNAVKVQFSFKYDFSAIFYRDKN
jgi:hypothetical protein